MIRVFYIVLAVSLAACSSDDNGELAPCNSAPTCIIGGWTVLEVDGTNEEEVGFMVFNQVNDIRTGVTNIEEFIVTIDSTEISEYNWFFSNSIEMALVYILGDQTEAIPLTTVSFSESEIVFTREINATETRRFKLIPR